MASQSADPKDEELRRLNNTGQQSTSKNSRVNLETVVTYVLSSTTSEGSWLNVTSAVFVRRKRQWHPTHDPSPSQSISTLNIMHAHVPTFITAHLRSTRFSQNSTKLDSNPMAIRGCFRFLVVMILMLKNMTSGSSVEALGESKGVKANYDSGVVNFKENELLSWVKWVGTLEHSMFDRAANRITPLATILVDLRRGFGHFTSVQDAIDHVPENNDRRVRIVVAPGVYKEKILVPSSKPYITLQGAGRNTTILQWNDTADTVAKNGEKLGTYWSASVAVEAKYFIARNIAFKNTAAVATPEAVGKQAVALRITGDAAAFYNCRFASGQDTLYDHAGRHYFKECLIEGSIDFIFGDGLSLYKSCHLHAIPQTTYGSVAAQKRLKSSENTGFSFLNCRITGSGLVYLGRAWGSYARVVYAYTYMDNIILPVGWSNWNDPQRNRTVAFGQYKCYGPGSVQSGRVPWSRELTDMEAHPFLSLSFVDGNEWIR